MVDYEFYKTVYLGNTIPGELDFMAMARRAQDQLRRYKQIYTVRPGKRNSEDMALCAMADTLYSFQQAQSGGVVSRSSVGSVSTSYKIPDIDISPAAQSRELFRTASLYLDITRGCG